MQLIVQPVFVCDFITTFITSLAAIAIQEMCMNTTRIFMGRHVIAGRAELLQVLLRI